MPLSPSSKKLLELLTPISKKRSRKLFLTDSKKVDQIVNKSVEFKNYETPSKLGFILEAKLKDHLVCPKCHSKLHSFGSTNYPTYDYHCDQGHNIQLKTSSSSSYFSQKGSYASVSRSALQPTINTFPILVCIQYRRIRDTLYINRSKSFVVVPNNKSIYRFKKFNIFHAPVISWNSKYTQSINPFLSHFNFAIY